MSSPRSRGGNGGERPGKKARGGGAGGAPAPAPAPAPLRPPPLDYENLKHFTQYRCIVAEHVSAVKRAVWDLSLGLAHIRGAAEETLFFQVLQSRMLKLKIWKFMEIPLEEDLAVGIAYEPSHLDRTSYEYTVKNMLTGKKVWLTMPIPAREEVSVAFKVPVGSIVTGFNIAAVNNAKLRIEEVMMDGTIGAELFGWNFCGSSNASFNTMELLRGASARLFEQDRSVDDYTPETIAVTTTATQFKISTRMDFYPAADEPEYRHDESAYGYGNTKFTQAQFIEYYGGTDEWDAAPPFVPKRAAGIAIFCAVGIAVPLPSLPVPTSAIATLQRSDADLVALSCDVVEGATAYEWSLRMDFYPAADEPEYRHDESAYGYGNTKFTQAQFIEYYGGTDEWDAALEVGPTGVMWEANRSSEPSCMALLGEVGAFALTVTVRAVKSLDEEWFKGGKRVEVESATSLPTAVTNVVVTQVSKELPVSIASGATSEDYGGFLGDLTVQNMLAGTKSWWTKDIAKNQVESVEVNVPDGSVVTGFNIASLSLGRAVDTSLRNASEMRIEAVALDGTVGSELFAWNHCGTDNSGYNSEIPSNHTPLSIAVSTTATRFKISVRQTWKDDVCAGVNVFRAVGIAAP